MTDRDDTPETDFDLSGIKIVFPDEDLAGCNILIGPIRLRATVTCSGKVSVQPYGSIRDEMLLHRINEAVRGHAFAKLDEAFTKAQEHENRSHGKLP